MFREKEMHFIIRKQIRFSIAKTEKNVLITFCEIVKKLKEIKHVKRK